MVHLITKDLSLDKRIALAAEIKLDMIYTLAHETPALSMLTASIDTYTEQLFGPKSVLKWAENFKPTATTRRNTAAYILAAASRPTEAEIRKLVSHGKKPEADRKIADADKAANEAHQKLIEEVGKKNAELLIECANNAVREERKLLTALISYGNAYTDCALGLPTPNKERRLQQSKKEIEHIVGQPGWEEFPAIMARCVDYQIDFYKIKPLDGFRKRINARNPLPEQGNRR